MTVSSAPLVSLDFTQRAPESSGDTQTMSVIGDFADQQDVALPSSYLTFQTADPALADVTATGQPAVAPGNTALVVSSHGIQAATVVDIDDPNALCRRITADSKLTHKLSRSPIPAVCSNSMLNLSRTNPWTLPSARRYPVLCEQSNVVTPVRTV